MPKPLNELIIEEEIRRLEKELAVLEGTAYEPKIEESIYLDHTPRNEGPEFLEVHASLWDRKIVAQGHTFTKLDKARDCANAKGYKGIKVTFGKASSKIA